MAGTREGGGGAPCLVCAGTASGVGKTALSTGLMAALRARGLKVQAFKAGPDFLDPMHHAAATGRPSINLDTWMLTREQVVAAYRRHTADADVAVVEGVMGLFDGRDGATEAGSTAQLAKWLGAPVLLVLDASALARSAAAVAKGYIEFDPELRLGGLLFNKVGGEAHTIWLRDALKAAGIKAPVLGGVPKNEGVVIPERHLGLHMPADETVPPNVVEALAELVSTHVDLDALLAIAATAEVPPLPEAAADAPEPAGAAGGEQPAAGAQQQQQQPVRIAVAHDAAFCFYYHDNLALLRESGAELVYFSPLTDPLPADVAGVYLGGGYPERFAAQLADNRLLRASLAAFAKAGGVVYAECGGLLYLSRSIQPQPDQAAFPMVGVFPFKTVVSGRKLSMGYVEVATREGCPLFPAGARVRGQVHHHSEIVQESAVSGLGQALSGGGSGEQGWQTCYTLTPQIPGAAEVAEGFCTQNVLASYVHLHFGNCPEFAASLVGKCRSVDVAAVSAAVTEAQQTAAYLESAVASLHTTPMSSKSGRSGVQHSRSSPDLVVKQGAAGVGVDVHRHHSEDGGLHVPRHHSLMLPPGDPSIAHHMMATRHASLQPPGMVGGMPGRSLSPTTALSKVVSMTSLNSYSAHAGPLPPGETLSPPLTDSPQQLSPRELEQQRAAEAPQYFGGAALHPHYMQQYAQPSAVHPVASAPYGYPPAPLPHQPHAAYSNGSAAWGMPDYTPPPPPPPPPGYSVQRSPGQVPNVHSWPRLHQPGGYANGPPGRQQSLSSAASPQFYAANGAVGGSMLPPPSGGSRHSRSDSFEQRPASASAAAMLMARSPSPLDLHSLERLEAPAARNGHASATPYNWQHSHHPSDKIVSLSPGATEMLWALGLGARVAAVSDACDYPPDVVARAKARRSFAAASASSYASLNQLAGGSAGSTASSTSAAASRRESPLAAQGRSALAAWQAAAGEPSSIVGGGGSAAPHLEDVVDEEVLARERPGLVVYEEDAAGSCAAASMYSGSPGQGGMGQAVLEALVAVGLQHSCRVVCVRRRTLSDVLDSMLAVGEAAGVGDEALRAVDRLRARLRRAAGEAARAAAAAPHRPRVLVLRSLRPLRTVGWWLPDQVMLAGGACDLEEAPGDAEVELTWQQVQALAPDVLIVAGMQGGSALRPLTDLCTVAGLPGWWNLPAVRASAVYVADAALFCRAGPRLVEGVECLARLLWGETEGGVPGCACPEQAVLKLSLRPGQRCRPRLLPNHFVPVA